jgi:hypothetical protein
MVPTRGTFDRAPKCVENRIDANNNFKVEKKSFDDSYLTNGRRLFHVYINVCIFV